ncbi:MAG: hypothetical protein ABEN55_00385 [Bradymonadaceae bacterium]
MPTPDEIREAIAHANDVRAELDVSVSLSLSHDETHEMTIVDVDGEHTREVVSIDLDDDLVRLTREVDELFPEVPYGLREAGVPFELSISGQH